MNKTNYFSHDSNARNDEKMIAVRMKLGAEGYGIYFMILERLRDSEDYMSIKDYNNLAFDFRVSSEKVKSVVEDFGLFTFTEDGKRFYSDSFLQRMNLKDQKSKKCSESGKKGMNIRYGKTKTNDVITNVIKNNNDVITEQEKNLTSKVKESKVNTKEKEKEKETAKRFLPPSIDEVKNFVSEKNYSVDPESFVAFYQSKNWFVGKNKMKDWRAAVVTWEKRNREFKKQTQPTNNVNDIWR